MLLENRQKAGLGGKNKKAVRKMDLVNIKLSDKS